MYNVASEQTEEEWPFQGSKTSPMFPPVCLKSHWDPTAMLRHIVPQTYENIAVPVSFRPYTKVCTQYVTAGPVEGLPYTPDNLVFPPGSDKYPPSRYINAVGAESLLRRLDRPLGTCEKNQYTPPINGDMYNSRIMYPTRRQFDSTFMIDELSMPKVLLRAGPYECRRQADLQNIAAAGSLFNNATKMTKYGSQA